MLLFSLFLSIASAQVNRVESNFHDISSASKIYLRPGLVSVLEFPDSVSEVRVGNPGVVKVLISQVSPRELTVYFKGSKAQPTNLIVKANKKVFLFDLIPSNTNHQDYLKIRGSIGVVGSSKHKVLFESAITSERPAKPKAMPLILEERESL